MRIASAPLLSYLAIGFAFALLLAQPALGQALARAIPPQAAAGVLEIRTFPAAVLDGDPVRLGPGARIRDFHNRIVVPASLSGPHRVLYTRDAAGSVNEAWLVTEAEFRAARKRKQ